MLMRMDVLCPLLTTPMKVKLLKPHGIARNQHGAYSDREEQELAPKRKALVSLNGIRRRCNARMFSQPHQSAPFWYKNNICCLKEGTSVDPAGLRSQDIDMVPRACQSPWLRVPATV